jgi:methyl-accepting chemotaxis protein
MRKKRKIPYFIKDIVPPLFSLIFALSYFVSVQRGILPFVKGYVITVAIMLLASRIPKVWYFKKYLIPPIAEYKRAKSQGRVLSTKKLSDIYIHLASFVSRAQRCTALIWAGAIIGLVIIDQIFLIGTSLSAVALIFTGLITSAISLALSYFVSKNEVAPLLEEIQTQIETPPKVDKYRVSLKSKIIFSVLGLNLVAFLAFGVLIYAKMAYSIESEKIKNAPVDLSGIVAQVKESPQTEWAKIISAYNNPKYQLALFKSDQTILASTDKELFQKRLRNISLNFKNLGVNETTRSFFYIFQIDEDNYLAAMLPPKTVSFLSVFSVLKSAFLYILLLMMLFTGYIFLLGNDISSVIGRIALLSNKISTGDLREIVPVWSDDELGNVSDYLRETYLSLRMMGRELQHAASIVDQEVNRTVHITRTLSEEAKHQLDIASNTGKSTEILESGIQKVSQAMDKVVMTTSDVSSIILQMQASVEEIASNADVLMKSVEKTVASANEMSTTAEQINSSTGVLRESSQESVSFLTELDAALQETMRNASVLQDTSVKVTQDAESGFSSVAAVEEEIIRSKKASILSLEALSNLQQSMTRISKIVDVIEEVTEQTNLLALNASIIAAGAGEYGKSFAVVATQIRELSSRTAGQAKEIRNVIKSLITGGEEMASALTKTQQVVENSVLLSRKAGEALKTILESASMQEELSKKISIAMEEIAHGGLTATESVNRIFQMIEGITRATEEQAKTTKYLHQEAEKVREVSVQLRNATKEQAKGTKVISDSMVKITSDSQDSASEVKQQAEETTILFENTHELLSSSKKIEIAFRELSTLTSGLQQSATLLNEEMKKYKI